jgi:glycosyltransferase involved in cell wall biosynthesis
VSTPDVPRDRSLALVMWGDLFEDFHDTIGISLERFRTDLTGGWLFGYVDALAATNVRTTIIHVSARVTTTTTFVHEATGAAVVILPAPRRHRWLRVAYQRSRGRKSLSSLASYGSLPVLSLARTLRRCGAEAILTQEYEHARFDALVALGRLLGLPVFATFQGGDAPRSRIERPVRQLTIRACAGLIVASGGERQRVAEAYGIGGKRVAPIANALDVASMRAPSRADARARLGIAGDACVVEWHGRVTIHRKGLDVLLAAWEQVCRERPDAPLLLLLVGTGPDAADFRRRIAATGTGNIRWRDEYVADRAELVTYQAAADVFVLPSRHEGFPVAPIEAMAIGLPVVAADAPGVADILSEGRRSGGIVVPREDPGALADALLELVDDRELAAELGAHARRTVEEHYSLEAVGAELRTFVFGDGVAAGTRDGRDR